jgi:hypothetical protein
MESPKAVYEKNRSKTSFRKDAYPFFNDKYFKDPNKAGFFLFDTNEREQVSKQKLFLPGRIYTFQYNPLYKDKLDYYDKRPIIFVHGVMTSKTGNQILVGINLNFLPEKVRVTVLEYFYQQFKGDYKKSDEVVGKIAIIQKAIQFLKNWLLTLKVFNDQAKVGYQFAFRNYIISSQRMKGLTMIENTDWEFIPFLQTKDVVGVGIDKIYQDYYDSLNANLKKPKPTPQKEKKNEKRYKNI